MSATPTFCQLFLFQLCYSLVCLWCCIHLPHLTRVIKNCAHILLVSSLAASFCLKRFRVDFLFSHSFFIHEPGSTNSYCKKNGLEVGVLELCSSCMFSENDLELWTTPYHYLYRNILCFHPM